MPRPTATQAIRYNPITEACEKASYFDLICKDIQTKIAALEVILAAENLHIDQAEYDGLVDLQIGLELARDAMPRLRKLGTPTRKEKRMMEAIGAAMAD
jgi:hypothetical protein